MNPIKEIRQREGLSQEDFSRLIDIHSQAVLLNEAGCYPTILPKIEAWLGKRGYSVPDARIQYSQFIVEKRERLRSKIDTTLFKWDSFTFTVHPFTSFRLKYGYSRGGFAKAFCIQPAFLYKLEKGEVQGLSFQVKEALLTVGFSTSFIEELNERCVEWATVKPQSLTQEAATS